MTVSSLTYDQEIRAVIATPRGAVWRTKLRTALTSPDANVRDLAIKLWAEWRLPVSEAQHAVSNVHPRQMSSMAFYYLGGHENAELAHALLSDIVQGRDAEALVRFADYDPVKHDSVLAASFRAAILRQPIEVARAVAATHSEDSLVVSARDRVENFDDLLGDEGMQRLAAGITARMPALADDQLADVADVIARSDAHTRGQYALSAMLRGAVDERFSEWIWNDPASRAGAVAMPADQTQLLQETLKAMAARAIADGPESPAWGSGFNHGVFEPQHLAELLRLVSPADAAMHTLADRVDEVSRAQDRLSMARERGRDRAERQYWFGDGWEGQLSRVIWPRLDSMGQRTLGYRHQSSCANGPAGGRTLPSFPWPRRAGYKSEPVPTSYFGAQPSLGGVVDHIVSALQSASDNYQYGLFDIPGEGIAIVARMERIRDDVSPYPEMMRWTTAGQAPLDLGDFMGNLFFERPGAFRVIAFVITDDAVLGRQQRVAVPAPEDGALVLPPERRSELLGQRSVYALVYTFRRSAAQGMTVWDTGAPAPLRQLRRSGVWDKLARGGSH